MASRSSFLANVNHGTCSLCQVCVNRCPTLAIAPVVNHDAIDLMFDSKLCNGCMICADLCPEKAIEVVKAPFEAREPFSLVKGNLTVCRRCQKQFVSETVRSRVIEKAHYSDVPFMEYCPTCRRVGLTSGFPIRYIWKKEG